METFRVRGIAKLADLVRRQLAGPTSSEALDRLRRRVADALEQLDLMLSDEGLDARHMAPSSRKAYEFLKEVDFDAVSAAEGAGDEEHFRGTVRLSGLKSFVEGLLARLARPADPAEVGGVHAAIRHRLEAIEDTMAREAVRPEHLKDDSRALRAWLAYCARGESLDRYVEAVGRARPAFEQELRASGRYAPPALVCFRPMRGIYRLRAERAWGTHISLPTPMIIFSREAYDLLAAMALRKARVEQAVIEHMLSPAYQDVLAELEELAGGGDRPAGVHHDLAAAFDRVNAEYFESRLARPRLVWGRAMTMRKFGHYDRVHDTIVVSASLDSDGVPALAVDFVLYHELLHKELGVDWRNGRRAAHTPEFRHQERRFRCWAEAQAVLRKLSRGVSPRGEE